MKKIIIGFLILMILISGCKQEIVQQEQQTQQVIQEEKPIQPKSPIDYELLNYEDGAVENFDILVSPNDVAEDKLQLLTNDLKKQKCKKSCNIFVFDDKKAYELNKKIDYLDDVDYIYVAEHNVAMLTFDFNEIWMYPLKDFYYEELKNK